MTSATSPLNLHIPPANFYLTSGKMRRIRTEHKDEVVSLASSSARITAVPFMRGMYSEVQDLVIIQVGMINELGEVLTRQPDGEMKVMSRVE